MGHFSYQPASYQLLTQLVVARYVQQSRSTTPRSACTMYMEHATYLATQSADNMQAHAQTDKEQGWL